MATSCLTYLSLGDLTSGPAESSTLFKERLSHFPLLRYAAVAWPHHVRQAGQPHRFKQRIYEFFSSTSRNQFMSWVQVLYSRRWSIDTGWTRYNPNSTPLYYAASFGLDETVRALIKDGVEINGRGGRCGATAFYAAVLRSYREIMCILKAGTDINKDDFIKVAPLDSAAAAGNLEIIKFLLEHGANIEHRDHQNLAVYQSALKYGQSEVVRLLLGWAREHGLEEKLHSVDISYIEVTGPWGNCDSEES